jgi:acyl carrier protein
MDTLLRILQELHPDIDFLTHQSLIDDQVIDSFDIITLVAEINDRIGVAIPAQELIPENFNSYASLKVLVDKLEEEI